MPKVPKQQASPYTPTRADASVITAGQQDNVSGLGGVTNNRTGKLQQKATTGKTITTGGTV
jgi:hypothetical protein